MTRAASDSKPRSLHVALAFFAIPLAAGGLVGLVDALTSGAAPGRLLGLAAGNVSAALLLTFLASFPFFVLSWFVHRSGAVILFAPRIAALLIPVVLLFGRTWFKLRPWSLAEKGGVAATVLGLALIYIVVPRLLSRKIGSPSLGRIQRGALATVIMLLGTLPIVSRIFPAIQREKAAAEWGRRPADLAADASLVAEVESDQVPLRSQRRNLLLLSIDTMRADRLGCAGNPSIRTPALDRLARGAIHFSTCRTSSPWTLPSLASLISGTFPGEHRMLEEVNLPSTSVPNLPFILNQEGWQTAAFVSNPWLSTGSLARGFQTFDVAEKLECLQFITGSRLARFLSKLVLRTNQLDAGARISGRGAAWIAAASQAGKPWMLWLHYFDPHLPNWPGAPFDRIAGPPPRQVGAMITVEEIRSDRWRDNLEARREIIHLYDAEVFVTDRAVGRLLRSLENSPGWNETVVVLTADHGEEFWDHEGYGHGHSMHEEVLRVPLIIRVPQASPTESTRIETTPARLVDVAPTALAALGVSMPSDPRPFSGRDLLFEGATASPVPGWSNVASSGPASSISLVMRDVSYAEATLYGPELKSLVLGQEKIILEVSPTIPDSTKPGGGSSAGESSPRLTGESHVFDLLNDPAELHNLSLQDEERGTHLREALQAVYSRVGADRTLTSANLGEGVDETLLEQLRALGYLAR